MNTTEETTQTSESTGLGDTIAKVTNTQNHTKRCTQL